MQRAPSVSHSRAPLRRTGSCFFDGDDEETPTASDGPCWLFPVSDLVSRE